MIRKKQRRKQKGCRVIMVKKREFAEMIRIDKNNRFITFYDDMIPVYNKIRIAFVEYDNNDNRTGFTTQFVDVEDMLLLADCIWNGDLRFLAKKYLAEGERFKSLLPFQARGGRRGGREDGSDLARKFDIYPGNQGTYLIQGEEGRGEAEGRGFIKATYGSKPDERVGVYVSEAELKKIASVLRTRIQAVYASEYVYRFSQEMKQVANEEQEEKDKYRKR